MVNQVLLFAETQSGPGKYDLVPVDVHSIIDRTVGNLSGGAQQGNYEILTNVRPGLPEVMADAAALTQCVQNLLSNAIKYGRTGTGARVGVLAEEDRQRHEVRITVTDEGPGIDASDRARLFEPFYRGANVSSNIPGNGLGLYLVKRLAEAQGGRVTFTNNSGGKGASFTLHLKTAPH
jgi:two-component system cell cycle sensor histidine kinase PleC